MPITENKQTCCVEPGKHSKSRLTGQRGDGGEVSISTDAAKAQHTARIEQLFLSEDALDNINVGNVVQCFTMLYLQDKPLYCVRTSRMLLGFAPMPFPACETGGSGSVAEEIMRTRVISLSILVDWHQNPSLRTLFQMGRKWINSHMWFIVTF